MNKCFQLSILALGALLWQVPQAQAQRTAYIGYVYPAGGQRGTTVQVRLGGQRLTGAHDVVVSGEGVSAKLVEYYRRLSNQDVSLLREQLRELRRQVANKTKARQKVDPQVRQMIARIEKRISEWINRPACSAHTEMVFAEITIAPDAEPGAREIRVVAQQGLSNPLPFCIGQVPEVQRKPLKTCVLPVLGKEELAQRKRPPEEVEQTITVPCTVNGQIAPGEVNWYRFRASKGQRLVLTTWARQLVPYIADAVPGWFQPVLTVYDANGREVAYNDDFRFKPDPTLYFEVPEDGEYLFSITDALYRGREDFVYRVTIGELPFVTSVFPLGGKAGQQHKAEMHGWNLQSARLMLPPRDAEPGVHRVAASGSGLVSNTLPFALGTLPEVFDKEPNNDVRHAQQVQLPVVVNGRIDRQDDWDVFKLQGKKGDKLVTEVVARRLDSPVDSIVKLTDAKGNVLGVNDDHQDPGSGLNTHHADSYLMATLPADGVYYVHVGDTARSGGPEYGYRLRISPPRPDFALRVVPSGIAMRSKSSTSMSVYVLRKDGFAGDITLDLENPPEGFMARPTRLPAGKDVVRFSVRTTLPRTPQPVPLTVVGRATVDGQQIVRRAVPADDRMQAFLWRHLLPAQQLLALVYNPAYRPPPKRVAPSPESLPKPAKSVAGKAKFTKGKVRGRLRQLRLLYEDWLLTDEFYARKVAECQEAL